MVANSRIAMCCRLVSHYLTHSSLGPQSQYLKHLDRFSRVCRAHCQLLTNRHTNIRIHRQRNYVCSHSRHYHAMHAMRPKIIAVKLLQQIGSQRPHRCCPWGIKLSPEYRLRASLDKCDPPKPKCPIPFGNPGLHLIHGSLGAKVHTPNGILVGWAFVVGLMVMTNRQTERHTDRPRYL